MEVKPMVWTYRPISEEPKQDYVTGEFEVRIRLYQDGDRKYIQLGYSTTMENWDGITDRPNYSHPHYKELTKKIDSYLEDIDFELKLAKKNGQTLTPIELKRKVLKEPQVVLSNPTQLRILEYFDKIIDELEEAENPGYAAVFIACKSTVSKLLGDKDKSFLNFSKEDHEKYEAQIRKGTKEDSLPTESTISHYLRTYYRVWNLAIKDKYFTKEEHHPSKYIKFEAYKTIRTKKRSIAKEHLGNIVKMEFDVNSREFRHLLYAQFMYFCRGMNFGDMCKLQKTQVANGGIKYTRSKNHREYDFLLHPKALQIINFFSTYPLQSDAGYVFPIFMAIHDTAKKRRQRKISALKAFNKDFKSWGQDVGWVRKVTSNSLRAAFATHLRESNVNISIIKEAMGHETEEQTNVYLDEIDDRPIANEVNRALNFDLEEKPKPEVQKRKMNR